MFRVSILVALSEAKGLHFLLFPRSLPAKDMRVLLAIGLQLAAAQSPAPLSASDSARLVQRLEQTELEFMFEWRYRWQNLRKDVWLAANAEPPKPPANYDPSKALRLPQGAACLYESTARYDFGRGEWMAHLIKAPNRIALSLCPTWNLQNWFEPPDERRSIDASLIPTGFPPATADTVRMLRARLIQSFDSAGARLPRDGWIAGQRVRLHVDQQEIGAARRIATLPGCGADFWWCFALLGYVEFTAGELSKASATFDRARKVMPDSIRCAWDDASIFFDYSGRQAYEKLTCAQRDSVNERAWWLADPLYVENGNERRTEHYARRVLIALHRALDVDERFDWRDDYQGPALEELILRYGWPTQIITFEPMPMRWHWGNTRSTFLGDSTIVKPLNCWKGQPPIHKCWPTTGLGLVSQDAVPYCIDGEQLGKYLPFNFVTGAPQPPDRRLEEVAKLQSNVDYPCGLEIVVPHIKYWGPQFHTVPLWQTVLDPFHATDEGWDLAPMRDLEGYWDASWWPLEFYRRDNGPLVPIQTQIAFIRRQNSAILISAMEWDTVTYLSKPLDRMIAAAIFSTGPNANVGARDTMSGRTPRPLVSAVPSGPGLLAIEMVPRDASGPSGRTRFGVESPPPLRVIGRNELALSDIVLARATDDDDAPRSLLELLPRMYGSTVLRDPRRVALFWELYGLGTGDTVDVSLRMVRADDSNVLERLGGLLGLASAGEDSVVIQWKEPRSAEPTPTVEAGVTIRTRGVIVDMSALSRGRYTVEIRVQRPAGTAVATTRGFTITRRK